jgi:cyclomaltodextrinase
MIPDWVPDAVFYQIFPERFCNGNPSNDPPGTEAWGGVPTRENFFGGDLAGITQTLDYIKDLGCNALYLNPIFRAATNHKYDTHDYFRIDPAFGDDAAFDTLIREAHARSVRVVLDGVFNHCGNGFAPFQDVLKCGKNSPYKDWFDIYAFPVQQEPLPNYATCGGAHYLPRLNAHHPNVEMFIHKVALYWLERGIDGWRCDVPYEIHTDFWRRFRDLVKATYPDAYLVAEEWRDASAFLQGDTFDGATHYLLRGAAFDFLLTNALTGDAFLRALGTLERQIPEQHRQGMLTLLGSHDTARVLTLCREDANTAVLLYTFLLTMPGAPLIYYGDENGMVGENDPDCRRTMVWESEAWNQGIRAPLKKLVELRNNSECLRRGNLAFGFSNDRIACYYRNWKDERALVLLNNSRVSRKIRIPVDFPDATVLTDALCGDMVTVQDGYIHFETLQPRRSWVFQQ